MKVGPRRGLRGIIVSTQGSKVTVRLDSEESPVSAKSHEITNYSLAARKAWVSMPHRRVGRPSGSSKTRRISVTLRIDVELWERFKRSESVGLIQDRTAAVNDWFRQKLTQLEKRSDTKGMVMNRMELNDG